MKTGIYLEVDSRSTTMSMKKYGYILECNIGGKPALKEGFGRMEGTYNCVTLEALIDALMRFNRPAEICVHTENNNVCTTLTRDLQRWGESGFITNKGMPVKNLKQWQKVWNLIQGHEITAKQGEHRFSGKLREDLSRTVGDIHV